MIVSTSSTTKGTFAKLDASTSTNHNGAQFISALGPLDKAT